MIQNEKPWWQGCSLYEIYPRSFMDSNGDGVGDLPGIQSRLPYVKGLGVDAIWIAPFFTSPMADFGYDISDHRSVDPIFGNLQDFKNCLTQAHTLGLRVLIDLVFSHTSIEHPWFKASRGQLQDKDDWYVWASAKQDGSPPNNWLSVFGGSAWSWDDQRQEYYLHHFLKDQPQLNLYNPSVRSALFEIARFWLDMGVDGFRLDAVDFYMHDPRLRDNPMVAAPAIDQREFAKQYHHHDMMQQYPSLDFLSSFRDVLDEYGGDRVAIGEVSSQPDAFSRIGLYTAPGFLHSAYTLQMSRERLSPQALIDAYYEMLSVSPQGSICWNFSNHDAPRSMTCNATGNECADLAQARLLAMVRQFLPGMDCLYQGEELGLTDAVLQESEKRDPAQVRCRDGSRTPMPWDSKKNGGFTIAAKSWLPIPCEHLFYAVDVQERNPQSLLYFYRRAIHLRQELSRWRGAPAQLKYENNILSVTYTDAGASIRLLANFSAQKIIIDRSTDLAPYSFVCLQDSAGEIQEFFNIPTVPINTPDL